MPWKTDVRRNAIWISSVRTRDILALLQNEEVLALVASRAMALVASKLSSMI